MTGSLEGLVFPNYTGIHETAGNDRVVVVKGAPRHRRNEALASQIRWLS